ncbi:MAG: glycosyltransferase family 4 protein [Solirubrobacterales bacterium]|nr:glycosyltransferase family 4 protein [Solirubrobacterales bacterium]
MRILYLHQFFMTREGTGGTRSYEFARRWVEAGHEVTMVTAAGESRPHGGRRRPGLTAERTVDGIRVLAVRGGYSDYVRATSVGYGRRLAGFGRFAAAATAAALRGPRPDVVFATSPPLTMALPAIAAARRWRAPLVFEVRDLWPEAPIQMGALRSPAAQRAARALERTVYRAAREIVALSPGMRAGIAAAGVPEEQIALIPNASDLDLFSPDLDPGGLRAELGLADGDFVCSYFGTMGEANDLGQVVEAAALLDRDGTAGAERRIVFVLQGDGKRRPGIAAEVERRGLGNVLLPPAGDKRSAARLAAASDACMTMFKDVPILATNSPNKLFDTFAAGRPAIVNTGGWMRELVEDHDAGTYVRPGDGADLAARLRELAADPERVRRLGANARALAEREFDRDLLAGRLRELLERVAGEVR